MIKITVGIVVMLALTALCLETPAFSACNPEPVIVNTLPRMSSGWSGSVAWYNGKIYEVADATSYALIKNPVTGETEGSIQFGSWAQNDTKGFTYDPFRGTFWCKVGTTCYEVAVTGGNAISSFPLNRYWSFGIWKDRDEINSMWVADPVYPHVVKVDIRDGSVLKVIDTTFNVRGVARVGNTLWCTYAGEPGERGIVFQIDMEGNELCKYFLPTAKYMHDAGGCEIDPDGYLWVEGGKGTAIYQLDIGYIPTTPTPATTPTPPPTPSPTAVPPNIDSGDYDGDGVSDLGIFHSASGLWAIRGVTRTYFGQSDDIPVSGDYDGDGTSNLALFRPASGLWAVRGLTRIYFGAAGDLPVPGDYNGDGRCEVGTYRPSSGQWAIKDVTRVYLGSGDDIPVPAYYELPHPKHIAIFRPSSGLWAVRELSRVYFGVAGDLPVPANYSSGSDAIPAIFRASAGLWATIDGSRVYFGQSGDKAVPGAYQGGDTADMGIFRDSSWGLWAIRSVTRAYFGQAGNIPVAGLLPNPSSAFNI